MTFGPEEFFENEDAKAGAGDTGTEAPTTGRRFKPTRFGQVVMNTDPSFLVDGLLPSDGLGVLYGPPKCGKSFWAFDVGMHIALGWNYRGRRTRQGVVVYIACEGERGLGARVEAFRIGKLGEEDDPDPPFYLLTTRLDLTGDVERLIEDLQAAGIGKTALVVVDTLNRSIHGSENRDEDMGAYVQAADRLQEVFGGLVLIVHHCGVNSERPRGHSSLTGAVDVQLKDERSVSGQVIVDVEFLKDGNEGERIVSVLTPLTVGIATDGSDITSCIIEPGEGEAVPGDRKQKRPHLTPLARIALRALKKAIDEAGSDAPASNYIPAGRRVAHVEMWRRYYYLATPSDTTEARKKSFQRARETLQGSEVIGLHDDLCWIV